MQPNLTCVIYLLMALAFGLNTRAQDRYPRHRAETVNARFALQLGLPGSAMKPALKNNMGNVGFGAGVAVLSNPFAWGRVKRDSPWRIGVEAGYTYYGRFLSEVNVNGYRGDYKTSYGILHSNAILQVRPDVHEYITPFLEILAGGNFYLSRTKQDLSAIESGLGVHGFDIGSYASAGFNKGIAIGFTAGKRKRDAAKLTVRLSYNRGTRLRYVIRNSLAYNPNTGTLEYYVADAPVRYLLLQVGIGI